MTLRYFSDHFWVNQINDSIIATVRFYFLPSIVIVKSVFKVLFMNIYFISCLRPISFISLNLWSDFVCLCFSILEQKFNGLPMKCIFYYSVKKFPKQNIQSVSCIIFLEARQSLFHFIKINEGNLFCSFSLK